MAALAGHLQAALAVAILSCSSVEALVQRARGADEIVCVSIAAFEPEAYIDALVENAMKMSESSTKFVLHLNSNSNYSDTALAKWETDRLSVSPERLPVRKFWGTLLYAHMFNAQHMDRRWKGTCSYYVMQMSNMWWVRPGFEASVRERRFGEFRGKPDLPGCTKNIPLIKDVTAPLKMYGWSKPEGSFFPMQTVRDFNALMRQHTLKRNDPDGETIKNARCNLETFALQMYAFNFNHFSDEERAIHQKAKGLSFTDCSGESVNMDEVRAVQEGKEGTEFAYYYAVKRVSRNLDHPVTKYIMSLTR